MPFKDKNKRRQYQKTRKKIERDRKRQLKEKLRRDPQQLNKLINIPSAAEYIFGKRELQKIANSMEFPSLIKQKPGKKGNQKTKGRK